jgi:hypothetical protein
MCYLNYAVRFSVKETTTNGNALLIGQGQGEGRLNNQAPAGVMKPNLVSALIQRGALR